MAYKKVIFIIKEIYMREISSSISPKTGLAGLKENWRSDLLSGFLVFLIALPLCLGISMASGFPPSAGIITAIIGGILVSRINGSYVTINGPAAGLIVVVLGAVQELGQGDSMAGYRYTLAAIVIASAIQILLGVLKAGRLSAFFPASVVHGMLAAIGIIIMAKQLHVLFGAAPEKGSSLLSTIAQIPHSILNPNFEIAIIGLTGLLILIIWSMIKNPSLKMIPAPLIVVIVGIGLAKYFDLNHEHMYLFLPDATFLSHHEETVGPKFLVAISENFMSSFYFPDFSKISTLEFWGAVLSISLVGTLETLLSAMAVDKLDPYKRHANLDKDLTAIGAGNLLAGLIGGLPMIAEIVRSSANVSNGAKTQWANFFHGIFLLIFVVAFPKIIHSIPLAALAALLVFTGYRLSSPKTFHHILKMGKEQLFMFVVTIIGVLATDLLIGVSIGILTKFILHLLRGVNLNNLFKIHFEIKNKDADTIEVNIAHSAIFSNFMPLKTELGTIEKGKSVIFKLHNTYFIDLTVLEFLEDFKHNYEESGGKCQFIGIDKHKNFSGHSLFLPKVAKT
jgi:MFS superfamily sulfate permease-like transporter